MKRFFQIDFLRAFSIFIVIVIHVLQYDAKGNSTIWFLNNYLNFVVVGFVFCSAYVLETAYGNKLNDLKQIFFWWKKRIFRLLIPFYIYLIIHYLLWNLFPNLFNGFDLKNNFSYIKKTILLSGGVGANWLPLLFLELAFIFPFLKKMQKNKRILMFYILFCFGATGFYTYSMLRGVSLFRYFRTLMIFPYSLVALLAMNFAEKESNRKYFVVLLLSFTFFILFFLAFPKSLGIRMFDHKYPPDFFYLSYSLAMTILVIFISKLKIFQKQFLRKVILFSSVHAYDLFFASYIVNDFFQKQRKFCLVLDSPLTQLFLTIFSSYLIIYLLSQRKNISVELKKKFVRLF